MERRECVRGEDGECGEGEGCGVCDGEMCEGERMESV